MTRHVSTVPEVDTRLEAAAFGCSCTDVAASAEVFSKSLFEPLVTSMKPDSPSSVSHAPSRMPWTSAPSGLEQITLAAFSGLLRTLTPPVHTTFQTSAASTRNGNTTAASLHAGVFNASCVALVLSSAASVAPAVFTCAPFVDDCVPTSLASAGAVIETGLGLIFDLGAKIAGIDVEPLLCISSAASVGTVDVLERLSSVTLGSVLCISSTASVGAFDTLERLSSVTVGSAEALSSFFAVDATSCIWASFDDGDVSAAVAASEVAIEIAALGRTFALGAIAAGIDAEACCFALASESGQERELESAASEPAAASDTAAAAAALAAVVSAAMTSSSAPDGVSCAAFARTFALGANAAGIDVEACVGASSGTPACPSSTPGSVVSVATRDSDSTWFSATGADSPSCAWVPSVDCGIADAEVVLQLVESSVGAIIASWAEGGDGGVDFGRSFA